MKVDVIVVGGGLAETIRGWTLRQHGLRIAIFETPDHSA